MNESQPANRDHIAIFYPWSNLGSFTSLRDSIAILIENGYVVDFFTQINPSYPEPGLDLPGFCLHNNPEAFLFFGNTYPWWITLLQRGRRLYSWMEMHVFRPLPQWLFYLNIRKQNPSYVCIIGIDPVGLVTAAYLAESLKLPYVYWSLELLISREIHSREQSQLKEMEIRTSRGARLVISQDPLRGQALADENGIDMSNLCFVPNAPRGVARRRKSHFLHKKLGISPERIVVLCAGNLDRWTMSAELVGSTANWPPEYILVMQSFVRKDRQLDKYARDLIQLADPQKVVISYDPVPQDDYREWVDSADVGLAFYASDPISPYLGHNVELMGLSSGKISGYLFSGLPIIVNSLVVGPKELVAKYKCGVVANKPQEIANSLSLIFSNYDEYTKNACLCFSQELELKKNLSPVLKRIASF